ncbi:MULTISPECIES: HNH endonuclease signature motif containing protein [Streptomyces]|uniref:HNH endonuclease n=1 Tax=Streptomyces venezuelae (strain ATCC 10712 / CBS 650.69 / DSM 40230 / JCM 4526 / NBRC 13096 / PD 04745) TaxID=953739 RepID=F2R0R6_STRVP|nr:HNH endonuclease signature motif containing protein [Streptomyces venezuelae]QER98798.1 HNH endonuclease [Streptomyces venezuelae ATCC 10712]CCA55433.1 HNH endonuclease [Streptomyces venezuelae ATCC 10712]
MASNVRRDPLERFEEQVGKSPNGHWVWAGVLSNGYGNFWDGIRKVPAHRWAYEYWVGPIPAGMQIDHLCRIRQCVNPEHLEPVTPRENVLRSDSPPGLSYRTGRCKHGHEMTPENTSFNKAGSRQCKACRRASFKRYREKKLGRPAEVYNRDKTHCPKGHPYDTENTYLEPDGRGRQCRTCKRQNKVAARARARAVSVEAQ